MYTPTPVPYASPYAMELGQKLSQVIQEFRQTHPGMSGADVGQALRIARLNSGADDRFRRFLMIAPAIVAAGIMAAALARNGIGRGRPGGELAPILIVAVVVALFAILKLARR